MFIIQSSPTLIFYLVFVSFLNFMFVYITPPMYLNQVATEYLPTGEWLAHSETVRLWDFIPIPTGLTATEAKLGFDLRYRTHCWFKLGFSMWAFQEHF